MTACRRPAPIVITVLAAALALAGCGPAHVADGPVTRPEALTYCSPGGVALTMNVFPPNPAPARPAPVAMYVHGGGWEHGDAGLVGVPNPVEASLVSRGFFVASINYRLAPKYRWPAQIEDAKCAVRFLRANATALHIDPSRIGVWGGSAGGHLVAMLGLAGPSAGFDTGEHLDQSSAVQAVVDEWGPADLTTSDWNRTAAQLLVPQVFGVALDATSPVLIAASPVTYVRPGAPPFLIIQGADDPLVHPVQSQELLQRLRDAGDSATLLMVAGAGHSLVQSGSAPISPSLAQVDQTLVDFFSGHLA